MKKFLQRGQGFRGPRGQVKKETSFCRIIYTRNGFQGSERAVLKQRNFKAIED
jgi:hypothetical protein